MTRWSHLQGCGSQFPSICDFTCSHSASGGSFQSTKMCCTLISISKLLIVCVCVYVCACVLLFDWHPVQCVPCLLPCDSWHSPRFPATQ